MLHALTVMSLLTSKFHFTGKIILAIDSLILIKRTQPMSMYSSRQPRSYEDPHMDIQCAIDDIIVNDFYNIEILHVRGHQDQKANAPLTWLENLNIRADAIATSARNDCPPLTIKQQCAWHPSGAIQLFINKVPINKRMKTIIHQSLTSDSYINYLRNKFQWDHYAYNEIDWHQKQQICKLIPAYITPWAIKLGTNRLPLNGEKNFPVIHHFVPSANNIKNSLTTS